jgi:hypothetical protein
LSEKAQRMSDGLSGHSHFLASTLGVAGVAPAAGAAALESAAGAAAFSPPQPRTIRETIKNIPLKSVFFIDKTPQSMLVLAILDRARWRNVPKNQ